MSIMISDLSLNFFPLFSIWCYYAGISTLGLTCKDTYTAHTPKYQNNNKHNVTRTQSCYTGENAHQLQCMLIEIKLT